MDARIICVLWNNDFHEDQFGLHNEGSGCLHSNIFGVYDNACAQVIPSHFGFCIG